MNKIIDFFIRETFIVNLVSGFIIIVGGFVFWQMHRDIQPPIDVPIVFINATLPGASPEQVEKQVTFPIEEALLGLPEIKKISSNSGTNQAHLNVRLNTSPDKYQDVVESIRARLDSMRSSLPQELKTLEVSPFLVNKVPLLDLNVINVDIENTVHRQWLQAISQKILSAPGIVEAKLIISDRHIFIDIDRDKIQEFEISLATVQQKIVNFLEFSPIGSFYKNDHMVVVEISNSLKSLEPLNKIPIRKALDGHTINLAEIAQIGYRSIRSDTIRRLNGKTFANIEVKKDLESDAIDLSEQLNDIIDELNKNAPEDISIEISYDTSQLIRNQLKVLTSSGFLGFFLVFLVLYFFLGFGPAMMTALGLPIAYLGTIIFLDWFGIGIDLISIIGMIIVVGILVDDAIIVTERFTYIVSKGTPARQAAREAAGSLIIPVSGTILTTIVAFSPMLVLDTAISRVFKAIPLVIIFALIVSWIECFFILPNHLRHIVLKPQKAGHKSGLGKRLIQVYGRSLKWIIKLRYLVVTAMLLFAFSTIYIAKEKIIFNMDLNFGDVSKTLLIAVKQANRAESTYKQIEAIEASLINKAIDSDFEIHTTVGHAWLNGKEIRDPRYATFRVSGQVDGANIKSMQEKITTFIKSEIEQIDKNSFDRIEIIDSQGQDDINKENLVSISIEGRDRVSFDKIAEDIEAAIKDIDGLEATYLKLNDEGEVWRFAPNLQDTALYGVSLREIAQQISSLFSPIEISQGRFQGTNTKVYTEVVKDEPWRFSELNNIPLLTGRNTQIKLGQVGNWTKGKIDTAIYHEDGQRHFSFDIRFNPKKTDIEKFTKLVEKQITSVKSSNPDYRILVENANVQASEAKEWAKKILIVCIALILLVMAIILRSLIQPLLIGLSIPIGIFGIVWALYFHGYDLTFLGIIGVIGVAGVAVNDSLIMLYAINSAMKANPLTPQVAAIEAACSRFRPIWLTTLTTISGVLPMAYGIGGSIGYTEPMAFSIGWGILSATFAALVIIPACNFILIDLHSIIHCFLRWLKPKAKSQKPKA